MEFNPLYVPFLSLDRYHEVFLIVDTCQAYSMASKLYSPNILGVGSSLVGEDSLSVSKLWIILRWIMTIVLIASFIYFLPLWVWKWQLLMHRRRVFLTVLSELQHHNDPAIGVHVIDRYTYYALQFLENVTPDSKASLGDLVSSLKTQLTRVPARK